jgi:uncharacterized protein (TIGR04255 family)
MAPHLTNAPIKEAIIDIKVQAKDVISDDLLEAITNQLPKDYTSFTPTIERGLGIEFTDNGINTQTNESQTGYKAECHDRQYIVQIKKTGITISKLAPYLDWADLKKEATILWNLYSEALPKHLVTRVATRYINQLELPLADDFKFEKYLTSSPTIPGNIEAGMSSFFTRLVVPSPRFKAVAIITQNLGERKDNALPLFLDIDVYRDLAAPITNDEMWAILDSLRLLKNEVFFKSITASTLELHQ